MSKGWSLDSSRKAALAVSAAIMPATAFVDYAPVAFAIAFYSLGLFGHQFWSANVQTLAADLFPSRVVGSVEGLLGSAGSLGAAMVGELFGWLIVHHGYGAPFLICGVLHTVSFGIILLTVRRIQPVESVIPGELS